MCKITFPETMLNNTGKIIVVEIMKSRSCLKLHWPETRESIDVGLIHPIPSASRSVMKDEQKLLIRIGKTVLFIDKSRKKNWHCWCLWKSMLSLEPFAQNSNSTHFCLLTVLCAFPLLASVTFKFSVITVSSVRLKALLWQPTVEAQEAKQDICKYSLTWSVCLNRVSCVLCSFHLRNHLPRVQNRLGNSWCVTLTIAPLAAPLSHHCTVW